MTYDMNDAQPQISSDIIPDGTFAKITMIFKPGTIDGASPVDARLLKHSNSPGSDVQQIDAEFTVVEGPYARRKFWQFFTVLGGKVDEQGVSIGWKITKSTFRSMIDSALGLDPQDMSEAAKAKPPSARASRRCPASPSSARSRSNPATTRVTRTATGSTASCCRMNRNGRR